MAFQKSFITLFVLFCSKLVFACQCSNHYVDINHVNNNDFWIKGVVKDVKLDKYTIEIQEVYKGIIATSKIIVQIPSDNGGNCGQSFKVSDEPILMFLRMQDGNYKSNRCSLNQYEKDIDEFYLQLRENYMNNLVNTWENRYGKLIGIGKMVGTLPEGLWKEYGVMDKRVISEGLYKGGFREGTWKVYDKDTGNLITEFQYVNGKRQSLKN